MKCPRCDSTVNIQQNFCPFCGAIMESISQQNRRSDTLLTVPWESNSAKDYPVTALLDTIQTSFFKAGWFFSKVKNSRSSTPAWIFGVICGSIGIFAGFLWSSFLPDILSDKQYTGLVTAQNLIFAPFMVSFQIFLTTAYLHFMLFLYRSQKAPIDATFRISGYALGAMILNAIPSAGPFLASIMWLYLVITGIHQVHLISRWKALAILFSPFLLLIFIVIVVAVAIGISGIATLNLLR